MHFFFSVIVFSLKVLTGNTIFYVSSWRQDRQLTWSSMPCKSLPAWSATTGVPSFLSYFKTLSIGPVSGIEPATFHSAVKRSTEWANPDMEQLTLGLHAEISVHVMPK